MRGAGPRIPEGHVEDKRRKEENPAYRWLQQFKLTLRHICEQVLSLTGRVSLCRLLCPREPQVHL